MMRKCSLTLFLLLVVAVPFLLLGTGSGRADDRHDRDNGKVKGPVKLLKTIPVPVSPVNGTAGALYSFDISFVDPATGTYYLADRSNKAVDVVDANTDTFVTQIFPNNGHAAFAGFVPCSPPAGANDCAGPNGVATSRNCLFVTDAPSRVVSFNKTTLALVSAVRTDPTDPTRADELAVDPRDSLILAINNASDPPFGTFVTFNPTTCTLTPPNPATDRVIFNAAHGVDATNGAEQPIWDPGTQKFYVSIPEIAKVTENGAVVRIDPHTKKVDGSFLVKFCSPAGLTLGPNEDVLVGCNTIFNTAGKLWSATGAVTAAPIQVILNVVTGEQVQVAGVGVGDEVWFNKGDGNYYTASSTSPLRPQVGPGQTGPLTAQGAAILGVIDAKDKTVLQLVPTFNVPAVPPPPAAPTVHPAGTAHSVAADAQSNRIFVPLAANNVYPDCLTGCIAVYWHGDEDKAGEAALP